MGTLGTCHKNHKIYREITWVLANWMIWGYCNTTDYHFILSHDGSGWCWYIWCAMDGNMDPIKINPSHGIKIYQHQPDPSWGISQRLRENQWTSPNFLMVFTSLPTPMTARVYVNLPEGILLYIYICNIMYIYIYYILWIKPIEFHVFRIRSIHDVISPIFTMVDNVVVSDSWIDLKVLWENLEGRIVLAFGRVNSSRKSGFSWSQWVFLYIVVFFRGRKPMASSPPWEEHGFPHQCTLFLIMVKVFRSRLSQPKKSLE